MDNEAILVTVSLLPALVPLNNCKFKHCSLLFLAYLCPITSVLGKV